LFFTLAWNLSRHQKGRFIKLWVAIPQRVSSYTKRVRRVLNKYLKHVCVCAHFWQISKSVQHNVSAPRKCSCSRRNTSRIFHDYTGTFPSFCRISDAVNRFGCCSHRKADKDLQQCAELYFSLTDKDGNSRNGTYYFKGSRCHRVWAPLPSGFSVHWRCLTTASWGENFNLKTGRIFIFFLVSWNMLSGLYWYRTMLT
jgi:hypothetical protein